MLFIVTTLFTLFAYTRFNCIRVQDLALLAIAFVPFYLYYRKESQRNLMLGGFLFYVISQIVVSVVSNGMAEAVKESGMQIFTFPDLALTLTGKEYALAYYSVIQDMSMMLVITTLAILQLVYYSIESSKAISYFSSTDYYDNNLRRTRDRLYSLKASYMFYTVLALMYIAVGTKYIDNKWLHTGIFIFILIIAQSVVQNVVDKEWAKKIIEVSANESKAELTV